MDLRLTLLDWCPPPKFPCSPRMIACSSTVIDTTLNRTHRSWAYAPVGGTVTLLPSDMPFQVFGVWGRVTVSVPGKDEVWRVTIQLGLYTKCEAMV